MRLDWDRARREPPSEAAACGERGLMAAITEPNAEIKLAAEARYKHGFVTDLEQESAPKGLDESTIRFISAKKREPAWLLDWRLKAYRRWLDMAEPRWAKISHPPIDYQDAYYFSAPK